jgi:hypothetical protein
MKLETGFRAPRESYPETKAGFGHQGPLCLAPHTPTLEEAQISVLRGQLEGNAIACPSDRCENMRSANP